MDKFSELKAAALDATPGPWHVVDQDCRWNIDDGNGVPVAITQQRTSTFNDRIQSDRTANTVFIAAANPAVVLALLAELEAKDKRIGELEVIATEYAGKFQKAQDANKHLIIMSNDDKKRIAELEAKLATPVRLPEAKDKSQGWTIDPEYLSAIAEKVGHTEGEGSPSMETVEAVLLAAGFIVEGDE